MSTMGVCPSGAASIVATAEGGASEARATGVLRTSYMTCGSNGVCPYGLGQGIGICDVDGGCASHRDALEVRLGLSEGREGEAIADLEYTLRVWRFHGYGVRAALGLYPGGTRSPWCLRLTGLTVTHVVDHFGIGTL
ncbi:hypothetical protein E2562_015271 [Oryza meyeriana var. granulata]|uniref:Uncharacterized protein n=1 Tax=Oryza meyeriana var. granulata TaxID=110450 RepID=A0A6G1DJK3_9ORYZ|nr:hypothetical protein E2562_015271 [Oryza meyeriana var. granulata]